jgi:AcrR family transcriptional regulator
MPQVGPEQYFDVALAILAESGTRGLKISPICRTLGVTSGSFYHHFDGWAGFVRRLLEHWETEQTAGIVELTTTSSTDPIERIDVLKRLAVGLPHAAEAAIRSWAAVDAEVGRAQRRVDTRRREALEELLSAVVTERDEAARLATFGVALLAGFQQTHDPSDIETLRWMFDDYQSLILARVDRERLIP